MDAHKLARGAVRGACAEGGPSISGQGEAMLLMVVHPEDSDTDETVLRTIDELQPGGTVNYSIPYRRWCAYTLFQGEPAKSCLCSILLFQSMLTLRRFLWGSIVMTKFIRLTL